MSSKTHFELTVFDEAWMLEAFVEKFSTHVYSKGAAISPPSSHTTRGTKNIPVSKRPNSLFFDEEPPASGFNEKTKTRPTTPVGVKPSSVITNGVERWHPRPKGHSSIYQQIGDFVGVNISTTTGGNNTTRDGNYEKLNCDARSDRRKHN